MKIYIAIITILFNILLSENLLDTTLSYDVEFRGIDAGEAFLRLENDTLFNKNVLRLNSNLKTNKFLDFFYRIRDDITIYLDSQNLSLIKIIKKIHEGKYIKNHTATYDENLKRIISKNKFVDTNIAYSPLSIIYSLRNKILNIDDIYNYDIYNLGKIKPIAMKVIKTEIIQTSIGEFDTIVVSPISDNKTLIRNNGDMKIWYTNDQNRYPVKIELKINYGNLILFLNSVK